MDTRQSKRCKFKEIAKIQIKMKICKYEMSAASTVEDIQRHDYVHRRTDGQTSKVKPATLLSGGIMKNGMKWINSSKFGASGGALNKESQSRISSKNGYP